MGLKKEEEEGAVICLSVRHCTARLAVCVNYLLEWTCSWKD